MYYIFHILCLVVLINALPREFHNEKTCGYTNCPKTDSTALNIHIVPHSHDDVGWLKTVDQYYYGSRSNIQHAGVQFILDSAIQALVLNPDRRFIYVETAFFWKWWQKQSEKTKEQVRYLVNNGQLEIIGGAWSMNDEAASHYQSTIDQFTWGFRILNETLGTCARPKIGWQIDPFGHSREQASLFAQFGFDGLFFARLDYRDKDQRLETKTAEMLWQGSQSLGSSSQIFTSILYNHYMTPPGFCFDVMCPDAPIVDDEESPEYNAEAKAKEFLDFARNQSAFYRTNNVIITMGGDFHYQDSLSYFINMDRLMAAMRKVDPKTKVFYSSPSCYLKAVNEANLKWTVKTDDFFPYASDPNSYWSGYFTSRPTSKRFERLGNNILQVTKQLSSLAFANSFDETSNLNPLRETMGVMQHHDAITGTEKQHVAEDYHRMLNNAIEKSTDLAGKSLQKLIGNENMVFQSCLLLNISQCEPTENNNNFLVTVYNPLSRYVNRYVRLPITKNNYQVYNSSGSEILVQIVPISEMIQNIPGRTSEATAELVFKAENIPPLGFKIYSIKARSNLKIDTHSKKNNNHLEFKLNKDQQLEAIHFKDEDLQVQQDFFYYEGASGNNMIAKNRSSGAYIFRPKTEEAIKINNENPDQIFQGPLVYEVHSKFNDWIGRVIRYVNNFENRFAEVNWIVGPIPVDEKNKTGKEIISRFNVLYKSNDNTKSSGEFYTDSNGREMLKRVRNNRSSFNLTHEEPTAQNYYPVTSKISLRNSEANIQVSVLNDRAQGGSSLHDNEIELMIHRRLLKDDAFGVEEALNEMAFGFGLVAIGKHYLTVGPLKNSQGPNAEIIEKEIAQDILLASWLFITPLNEEQVKIISKKDLSSLEMSGLKNPLPSNVQILTLEPWGDNTILLRLENIFEKDDDSNHSTSVSVDIKDLFSNLKVKDVQEMTLGANQVKTELNRLQWQAENNKNNNNKKSNSLDENMIVTLNPMEIKTFIVKV